MELDRLVARTGRLVARVVVFALIVGALIMTLRSCIAGDGGSLRSAESVKVLETIGQEGAI